jgi:hypothetical protein
MGLYLLQRSGLAALYQTLFVEGSKMLHPIRLQRRFVVVAGLTWMNAVTIAINAIPELKGGADGNLRGCLKLRSHKMFGEVPDSVGVVQPALAIWASRSVVRLRNRDYTTKK